MTPTLSPATKKIVLNLQLRSTITCTKTITTTYNPADHQIRKQYPDNKKQLEEQNQLSCLSGSPSNEYQQRKSCQQQGQYTEPYHSSHHSGCVLTEIK